MDALIKGLQSVEDLQNQIWWTLIGLKLLEQEFERTRSAWKLVAAKARQALVDELGFKEDVDTALAGLEVNLLED